MDQSYSDSDVSLSPTQILERLQVLRQLQLMQRGKLQKQRLQYSESGEQSTTITDIISQFSSSTSYNSFMNLLHVSEGINDHKSYNHNAIKSPKVNEHDLVEGVSVLNISQESEHIVNSPISSTSRALSSGREDKNNSPKTNLNSSNNSIKKNIELDEMPVLTQKKDFNDLILEKIQNEETKAKADLKLGDSIKTKRKSFLKRGVGMSRFGLKKNDLVIQSTKSLPWKNRSNGKLTATKNVNKNPIKKIIKKATTQKCTNKDSIQVQFVIPETNNLENLITPNQISEEINKKITNIKKVQYPTDLKPSESSKCTKLPFNEQKCVIHDVNLVSPIQIPRKPDGKHPLLINKGKTWAAILTKEQDDFLRQLKQSDYYKNFASPAKSTISDMSCDENLNQLRHEREMAEQNMFELLENKVQEDNFNLENSFFNRFLRRTKLDCSGESTPLVLQKCLSDNPNLLHIFSETTATANISDETGSQDCNSECTNCDHETCSSVSTCSSCKTVEEINDSKHMNDHLVDSKTNINQQYKKSATEVVKPKEKESICLDDTVTDKNNFKANIEEMNSKLVATSELLKERLRELEDEIEMFRKENANLSKMREEIDSERQKFYIEKASFEQKFNEDKIMSDYYLAEEKEKLTKQKQMYERYVREMRGRLNKKEKDDVLNLKKEISDLKDEIRMKDAKSTAMIARLRNQIKILEKDKKEIQGECEKLKKENIRIRHMNDTTRRLTNIKYLEEINRKLENMSAKGSKSELVVDSDVKYKAYEIEKQTRRAPNINKNPIRQRAKSVPNLNVTSRYAKYFSQRDAVSEFETNQTLNVDRLDKYDCVSDEEDLGHNEKICEENMRLNLMDSDNSRNSDTSDKEEDNNLERIYIERFKSKSPESSVHSARSDGSFKNHLILPEDNDDPFFIRKSTSSNISNSSQSIRSNSPYLINRSNDSSQSSIKSPISIQRNSTKSPVSILSNRSLSSNKSQTVVEAQLDKPNIFQTDVRKPELSRSSITKNDNTSKTSLNPLEIKKPDGTKELRFPNGNIKYLSADGKYSKFTYYNGDVKETFYNEGRIKYFYSETKTYHTTHADGLEVLEFAE